MNKETLGRAPSPPPYQRPAPDVDIDVPAIARALRQRLEEDDMPGLIPDFEPGDHPAGERVERRKAKLKMVKRILNDKDAVLTVDRKSDGLFIPVVGEPSMVTIKTVYKVTDEEPFVRIHRERFQPFLTTPMLSCDLDVMGRGLEDTTVRVFRSTGAHLAVNRNIHTSDLPENPWRGDVLVMGRGIRYFYGDLSEREVSPVILALDQVGDVTASPVVRVL
ncbi:hypothetical protein AURDEDRAFT_155202 [Auricularia subglabra TFB-10046 SS5]|nr:hypothetical protein AURDEDRAFT_155202 [Auricularia subglabra TFB-10046 SS5]